MGYQKDHFKSIVTPVLEKYIKNNNYNKVNYNFVKNLVENLDNICICFFTYIKSNISETYNDQINTLVSIAESLENIVKSNTFNNNMFKLQLVELLDFRNISSIDVNKTKICDEYVSKCLKILIEYMVSLEILSRENSKEYLRISSIGFVPI
jgi:hypothetical protein